MAIRRACAECSRNPVQQVLSEQTGGRLGTRDSKTAELIKTLKHILSDQMGISEDTINLNPDGPNSEKEVDAVVDNFSTTMGLQDEDVQRVVRATGVHRKCSVLIR